MNEGLSDPAPISASETPELRAFSQDTNPRSLYLSPTLQQRLDLIEHLMEFGRQIVVLSGAPESGKTTLLGYFAAAQRASWYPVRVQANAEMSAEAMIALLAHELDVPAGALDHQGLRDQVRLRISALERAGKVVVVLVDDAEKLSAETAEVLVKLAHTEDQLAELRVLLATAPEHAQLLANLQRSDPQHGLVHVVDIPLLADAQIQGLIEQRMAAIELEALDFFSPADFTRIAAVAEGLAGKVVSLARQHLSSAIIRPQARMPATSRRLSRTQINVAFGILAVGALVLGAWWATRNPLLKTEPQTTEVVDVVPPGATPPSTPGSVPTRTNSEVPALPVEKQVETTNAAPAPLAQAVTSPASAEAPTALTRHADKATQPSSPAESGPPATNPTPVLTGVPPAVAIAQPVLAPVPVPQAPPPAAKSNPKPAAHVSTGHRKVSISKPLPKQRHARKSIVKPAAGIASEAPLSADWLLKQPAGSQTLQLFGVRTRGAADRYRAQHGILTQSVVLTGMLDRRPLYLVVCGGYPTRQAAQAAVSRLPASVRGSSKPWVRSIGSLRQALK